MIKPHVFLVFKRGSHPIILCCPRLVQR
jgi:hypothetical protein